MQYKHRRLIKSIKIELKKLERKPYSLPALFFQTSSRVSVFCYTFFHWTKLSLACLQNPKFIHFTCPSRFYQQSKILSSPLSKKISPLHGTSWSWRSLLIAPKKKENRMDLTEGVGESSSPPRSFGSFSNHDVRNDVYNRFIESGHEEAVSNPELFREHIDSHFNRLPARFSEFYSLHICSCFCSLCESVNFILVNLLLLYLLAFCCCCCCCCYQLRTGC
jgi:hypothetical protein